MTDQFNKLVGARLLIVRIVWIAITGSVVFYFFIAYLFTLENTGDGVRAVGEAVPAFYAAAAVVAVISVIFRIWSFSRGNRQKILGKYRPDAFTSDSAAGHVRSKAADDVNMLSDEEKRAFFLLGELQKYTIINMILNEIVILIGFILVFLTADIFKFIPFGAVALLLCLWMFPRTESVAEKSQINFQG